MQDLYATTQLPTSAVGPSSTDQYLQKFAHPTIHHLVQLVATPHSKIHQHLGIFTQLHPFIQQLQQESLALGNENKNAIVDLRNTMETIHSRLQLVASGSESFTCLHVSRDITHINQQIEQIMIQYFSPEFNWDIQIQNNIAEAINKNTVDPQWTFFYKLLQSLQSNVGQFQTELTLIRSSNISGSSGSPGPSGTNDLTDSPGSNDSPGSDAPPVLLVLLGPLEHLLL
ncbi:hypothetical protein DSO57_1028863 [Entomophthora muscae]|uniref:Uncharacterized protein n=1 Tax=Entomophthora muscae TaxID=34485 RepID=A0ACC2UM29_9FUNG|nr:hypothetical protein DSO57_1028863 [Entomophthora muscae]